jgi:threonyl-tRNA synthetase
MDNLDHRRLGEALDLFHFQDDAPGAVFWHPRGFALYKAVEDFVRRRVMADGYREVRSPQMMSRSVWERSGHWGYYGDKMFVCRDGERAMAVKPMNCPGHVEVFRHGSRSWRDLPMRLAEFGICHRDEPSGSLHGLLRLRGFVQDDGHVFCSAEQVEAEVRRFCALLRSVYGAFGFAEVGVALSLRPVVRAGSDAVWDEAEASLAAAAAACGLDPEEVPGDGAFYGPKLEFSLRDRAGRAWQCGTLQLDLVLPGLLGASYADKDGGKAVPVLLHRAVLGSLERFVGILLEHHGAALPPWLAPEQVLVASISERQEGFAAEVAAALAAKGARVRVDAGAGRIAAKVRDAAVLGVPVAAVVGDKEASAGAVDVRFSGARRVLPVADAAALVEEICAPPR